MHSSRMCTARLMPVSPSMHCSQMDVPAQGVYLPGGNVYLPGGWGVPGWGCTGLGGCICWGWVYLARGCTCLGGVPAQGEYLPGGYLLGDAPAQVLPCCEQNSWHMLLKVLPCPKLRLRAVNIHHAEFTILVNRCIYSFDVTTLCNNTSSPYNCLQIQQGHLRLSSSSLESIAWPPCISRLQVLLSPFRDWCN